MPVEFSAGINPDAYWCFLLFYVPEWGRRQDGESCGKNTNKIRPSSCPSVLWETFIPHCSITDVPAVLKCQYGWITKIYNNKISDTIMLLNRVQPIRTIHTINFCRLSSIAVIVCCNYFLSTRQASVLRFYWIVVSWKVKKTGKSSLSRYLLTLACNTCKYQQRGPPDQRKTRCIATALLGFIRSVNIAELEYKRCFGQGKANFKMS